MNTKKIIDDAAFQLFEKKSFSRITVQDILEASGVSRGSFYKYYSDKYELMRSYFLHQLSIIAQRLEEDPALDPYEVFYDMVWEKKAFFMHMEPDDVPESFWNYLIRFLVDYYVQLWSSAHPGEELSLKDRCYFHSVATSGTAVIVMRIKYGNAMSSKDFADIGKRLGLLEPH